MTHAKYRKWCLDANNLPLFAQPWWLDTTCDRHWQILSDEDDGQHWLLPFHRFKSRLLWRNAQPYWTQYSWIVSKSGTELKPGLAEQVLSQLPRASFTSINLAPAQCSRINSVGHASLFHPRVTFQVHPDDSVDFRSRYSSNLKRNLRKASEAYVLSEGGPVTELIRLVKDSFSRQKYQHRIDKGRIENVVRKLIQNKCGKVIFARLNSGEAVGAICIGWDAQYTYYIMGGQSQRAKMPSPHSLLLDEAIRLSVSNKRVFDFCGSMIPGVQRFFRSFGGTEITYYQYQKYHGLGLIKKHLTG